MIEDEIDTVVFAALGDAELAGLETEAATKLEQEFLEVVEKDRFKIEFGVFRALGEAREFENIGIAQDIGDALPGFLRPSALDDGPLVGGEAGPFVEQGADLALELPDRPSALDAFVFVEGPTPRIVKPDKFLQVRP